MRDNYTVKIEGGKYDGKVFTVEHMGDVDDIVEEYWDNDADYWVTAPNGITMEIRDMY